MQFVLFLTMIVAMGGVYAQQSDPVTACSLTDQAQVTSQLVELIKTDASQPFELIGLSLISPWPQINIQKMEPDLRQLRSRIPVELTGVDCQSRMRKVTVWFRLEAMRMAWVYGRHSEADQPVTVAEPQKKLVDMAGIESLSHDLADNLDGRWLVRSTQPGRPVLNADLQDEPMVFRNRSVQVIVRGGGLQLRTRGTVLQSGQRGHSVQVMVEGATISTTATVSGKGEVFIEI
ncbi:MAG: flagellar basal body P-ring formation chaperone FlgA [Fluviicoccus sp.]|uniref:flagellar basal body P-ring formation chaperone FlgA n=1 Tax=Fluviicoccus sp. TaxID=2003552 RepID=UPI0027241E38|nr:flagellar basal body P-ring formation chaperone FlgA [Fluviicoccus sp.]MDO8330480.1 flagellar basal body P-ring formation chaperone FlgA [Fluviicoccus sp.]